nr:ABC transporter B family member 11 [Ipomoea batatas]
MTRGGSRVGRIRGRGRGALVTPPLVEPIVTPSPTVVSPPIVSPASIGSPSDLPIPSPLYSTAPPTSSSIIGSSIGCDLPIIHVEEERMLLILENIVVNSRHTGGSRSAIEHYRKFRDELQNEPNLFECFAQMHKKKNGMLVDQRSKRIVDEIQARHDAVTQEAEKSAACGCCWRGKKATYLWLRD